MEKLRNDTLDIIIKGIEKDPADVIKCLNEIKEDKLDVDFFGNFSTAEFRELSPSCKAAISIYLGANATAVLDDLNRELEKRQK